LGLEAVIEMGPGGENSENESQSPKHDTDRNEEPFFGEHMTILSRTQEPKSSITDGELVIDRLMWCVEPIA